MKKFFWCLMAFATLVMVACDPKNDPNPKPIDGDDDDPIVESIIAIDGDFADWDALAGNPDLAVATRPDNSKYECLYTIKFVTDPDYIYFFVEFDAEQDGLTEEGEANYNVGPIDFYLNVDGDDSTGSNSYLWENSAADILIEGFWSNNYSDAGVFTFPDDADQTAWAWEDAGVEGATSTCDRVILPNGHAAIEGQIIRALIPVAIKALKVGVFSSNSGWAESGCLPATVLNEDGTTTPSPLLEVKLN